MCIFPVFVREFMLILVEFVANLVFGSDLERLWSSQIGENRRFGGLAVPGGIGSVSNRSKRVRDVFASPRTAKALRVNP